MHYYTFNIADYRKDTVHLSLLEHGIYRQMLDLYYMNEEPLPLDEEYLMRLLCVRNADEMRAHSNVLRDFFEKTEKGYFHKRCDTDISNYHAKSDKARASAKARWSGSEANNDAGVDANAMRTHTERNANGMLTNNHKPIIKPNKILLSADTDVQSDFSVTDEKTEIPAEEILPVAEPEPVKKIAKPVDEIPYQAIADLYNEICIDLPACSQLSEKRKSLIKSRWLSKNGKGEQKRNNLDWWKKFFTVVNASDFLNGRDSAGWKVTSFEWLVNEANFLKIVEGGYSNKRGGA